MTELLKNEKTHFLIQFESSVEEYLKNDLFKNSIQGPRLSESIAYSLKTNGKRFRPFLVYLIFKLRSEDFKKFKSWALAIEFIHTYSLIHDDLPCMDNDDYRRGVLTNHKVYGDDIALLAGDSLISEAFRLLAEDEQLPGETRLNLIQLLSSKIGPLGMVGGQVLDMKASTSITFEELKTIHFLKTSLLIQTAALGAAQILKFSLYELNNISEFSLNLGMAFQIKDDLLDYSSTKQDFKSYVHQLGIEKTNLELKKYSEFALEKIILIDSKNKQALMDLIQYNLDRIS